MVSWWIAVLGYFVTPIFMLIIWFLQSRHYTEAEQVKRRFEIDMQKARWVEQWDARIRDYLATVLLARTDAEIRRASREIMICASYVDDTDTQLRKDIDAFFVAAYSRPPRKDALGRLSSAITQGLNILDADTVTVPGYSGSQDPARPLHRL